MQTGGPEQGKEKDKRNIRIEETSHSLVFPANNKNDLAGAQEQVVVNQVDQRQPSISTRHARTISKGPETSGPQPKPTLTFTGAT